MDLAEPLLAALDFAMRETALFAATGFLLLGLSDLIVDAIWLSVMARRWAGGSRPLTVEALAPPSRPGALAVFVPAWDEAGVIGPMLRRTLVTFDHDDYRIYVGCYANDPATIGEVRGIGDRRIRLVVASRHGPTTKADCLNNLWEAMLADEAEEDRRFKGVVLHDAEDVVHPDELRIFATLVETHDLVQLPVRPLIDAGSRWIGGHYADEFAESHAKEMVVREAVGAALPSAGVGCAFSREILAKSAARQGGAPFDAASLTEDYELGLKLRTVDGSGTFARITSRGELVTTQGYFPATFRAAVRQKARWVTGIALSGWHRLGWSGGLAERSMRLRDRQSLLAAVLLFAGYGSFAIWSFLESVERLTGWTPAPIPGALAAILQVNLILLAWRLTLRFGFTAHAYGWREGLRSTPRVLVSNMIAMCSAGRALAGYRRSRKTSEVRWDKTRHAFPVPAAAE